MVTVCLCCGPVEVVLLLPVSPAWGNQSGPAHPDPPRSTGDVRHTLFSPVAAHRPPLHTLPSALVPLTPPFTADVLTLPCCHSTLLTSLELQGASAEKVVLVFTSHGHIMVGTGEFCQRSEGKVLLRIPQFFDSGVDLFHVHQNLTGSTCFLSTSKEVDICSSCLPVRLGAR